MRSSVARSPSHRGSACTHGSPKTTSAPSARRLSATTWPPIGLAVATTFLRPGDRVVVPQLTYYLYGTACAARGAVVHEAPTRELRIDVEALLDTVRRTRAKIVWLCDPNNPTGDMLEPGEWAYLLDQLPGSCVAVVDEAYVDFVALEARLPRLGAVEEGRPVVVLRSFSKFFGLAGLRLGYTIADAALTDG